MSRSLRQPPPTSATTNSPPPQARALACSSTTMNRKLAQAQWMTRPASYSRSQRHAARCYVVGVFCEAPYSRRPGEKTHSCASGLRIEHATHGGLSFQCVEDDVITLTVEPLAPGQVMITKAPSVQTADQMLSLGLSDVPQWLARLGHITWKDLRPKPSPFAWEWGDAVAAGVFCAAESTHNRTSSNPML